MYNYTAPKLDLKRHITIAGGVQSVLQITIQIVT